MGPYLQNKGWHFIRGPKFVTLNKVCQIDILARAGRTGKVSTEGDR
jgi:hypothetical protein